MWPKLILWACGGYFDRQLFLGKMYNSRLFGGVKMLIGIVKCKDNW